MFFNIRAYFTAAVMALALALAATGLVVATNLSINWGCFGGLAACLVGGVLYPLFQRDTRLDEAVANIIGGGVVGGTVYLGQLMTLVVVALLFEPGFLSDLAEDPQLSSFWQQQVGILLFIGLLLIGVVTSALGGLSGMIGGWIGHQMPNPFGERRRL